MTDNNFHKLAINESFERVAQVAKEREAFNEQAALNDRKAIAALEEPTPEMVESAAQGIALAENSYHFERTGQIQSGHLKVAKAALAAAAAHLKGQG